MDNPITITPHKDILKKLLEELVPIDFAILIRSETTELRKEFIKIMRAYNEGNTGLHNELNKPKVEGGLSRKADIARSDKKIQKRITQYHYSVCIITQLLKIVKAQKWDLCECYNHVYVYNGAYWKQLDKDDLKQFIGEVAIKFSYPEIDAMHHKFKDELFKQFFTQAHLPAPDPDTKKIQINLENGTFDFKAGGRIRQFAPEDFLTYQLPFKHNPEAVCPRFIEYLNAVLPDKDSQAILQEFCGYIFTNLNLEKCLVLTGGGSNGKSVFFNILTALLGEENVLTYIMGMFNKDYNRAKLTDVLVN